MIHNLGQFAIEFSTKDEGNLRYAFGEREVVKKNRDKFASRVGVSCDEILWMDPTHSPNICLVDDSGAATDSYVQQPIISCELFERYQTGFDGNLTFDKERFIGVLTADCIPLLVWHHETYLHGIVHVGLLGLLNNIAGQLALVYGENEIEPSTVNYFLGPAISSEHYNVTNSFLWKTIRDQALTKVPEIQRYLIRRDGNEYLDMASMLVDQLLGLGSSSSLIQSYRVSTADDDSNYFSHYRARQLRIPNGRFASIIGPKITGNSNAS